jgi:hypothetical protein
MLISVQRISYGMISQENPLLKRVEAREAFRSLLADRSGLRVELVITKNRVSMVSVHFQSERHVKLRLHEAFLLAPDAVVSAMIGYLRSRRKKYWAVVSEFASQIPVQPALRTTPCHTKGNIYDLQPLAQEINDTYFGGQLIFRVGWGKRGKLTASRSIRYGSCNTESKLIRLHPLLDDARVPEDFLKYLLFHEMLHLVIPAEHVNGRRFDHPHAFRIRERQYPDFAKHKETAKRLLHELRR